LRTFGPYANGIPLEVFGIEIDNDDVSRHPRDEASRSVPG